MEWLPLIPASIARNVRPGARPVGWRPLPRDAWDEGDFVVGRVESPHGGIVEAPDGHQVEVERDDLVVGALGRRNATLEVVGGWESIGPEGAMQTLTRAGLFGVISSMSRHVQRHVVQLRYVGHLEIGGTVQRMSDWRIEPADGTPAPPTPTVALIGTSMSSGKTTTARVIIRRLRWMGLSVAGAKLAGVARFADVLAMRDSGAAHIVDFVDAGLPSTVGPADVVTEATRRSLAAIDAVGADVLVAEVGASPLEPYRGDTVLDVLGSRVRLAVLCASDPYAVVGATEAFHLSPAFVAGRAASTTAAVALVDRLSGREAIDVTDPDCWPRVDEILAGAFPESVGRVHGWGAASG